MGTKPLALGALSRKTRALFVIVQRLDAERVAHQIEFVLQGVDCGKGIHPIQQRQGGLNTNGRQQLNQGLGVELPLWLTVLR